MGKLSSLSKKLTDLTDNSATSTTRSVTKSSDKQPGKDNNGEGGAFDVFASVASLLKVGKKLKNRQKSVQDLADDRQAEEQKAWIKTKILLNSEYLLRRTDMVEKLKALEQDPFKLCPMLRKPSECFAKFNEYLKLRPLALGSSQEEIFGKVIHQLGVYLEMEITYQMAVDLKAIDPSREIPKGDDRKSHDRKDNDCKTEPETTNHKGVYLKFLKTPDRFEAVIEVLKTLEHTKSSLKFVIAMRNSLSHDDCIRSISNESKDRKLYPDSSPEESENTTPLSNSKSEGVEDPEALIDAGSEESANTKPVSNPRSEESKNANAHPDSTSTESESTEPLAVHLPCASQGTNATVTRIGSEEEWKSFQEHKLDVQQPYKTKKVLWV